MNGTHTATTATEPHKGFGQIKWGIIGAGKIAADFVAAMRLVKDSAVIAVGSRTQAVADAFGQQHGISKCYGSYEELAADEEVDVVYVCTPHSRHFEAAALCIKQGKGVLVEKALTINAQEAEELIGLAKKHNVFLMHAMWTRYFPLVRQVRERVAAGDIGTVKFVHVDFGFVHRQQERLVQPELAGGTLLDIGVYCIAFASMVFGGVMPTEIKAVGNLLPTGVDGLVGMLLHYPCGGVGVLSTSFESVGTNQVMITGTKGRVVIDDPFWAPVSGSVHIHNNGKHVEEKLSAELPSSKELEDHTWNFRNSVGLSYEIEEVVSCLKSGKLESQWNKNEETLFLMKIMDEARRQIGVVYPKEKDQAEAQ
ncbi:Oxidoreductase [Balamuthia mandrillaris]